MHRTPFCPPPVVNDKAVTVTAPAASGQGVGTLSLTEDCVVPVFTRSNVLKFIREIQGLEGFHGIEELVLSHGFNAAVNDPGMVLNPGFHALAAECDSAFLQHLRDFFVVLSGFRVGYEGGSHLFVPESEKSILRYRLKYAARTFEPVRRSPVVPLTHAHYFDCESVQVVG